MQQPGSLLCFLFWGGGGLRSTWKSGGIFHATERSARFSSGAASHFNSYAAGSWPCLLRTNRRRICWTERVRWLRKRWSCRMPDHYEPPRAALYWWVPCIWCASRVWSGPKPNKAIWWVHTDGARCPRHGQLAFALSWSVCSSYIEKYSSDVA